MNEAHAVERAKSTIAAFDALESGSFLRWFSALGCEPRELPKFVDVHARSGFFDRTLLAAACEFSNIWMLEEPDGAICILAKTCDPNAVGADGMTPIHLLSRGLSGFESAADVKALLDAGADPQVRCWQGQDALCMAARRGCAQIVEALIGPCNPLAKTHSGMTPLMLAAASKYDQDGRCAALLAPVSDLAARDSEGLSALDHAKRCQTRAAGPIQAAMEAAELARLVGVAPKKSWSMAMAL